MNTKIVTILIATSFLFSASVNAASFYWLKQGYILPGQESSISLMVDTQEQEINAFEGTLIVPEGVNVKATDDGGSIISLWIEKPPVSRNEMYFSGGLPGGYRGKAGKLFTVTLVPEESKKYNFEMRNLKALLNDGLATEAKITNKDLVFEVDKGESNNVGRKLDDIYPPESFVPVISRQSDIFNDKYFLVFSTTDKDSGIDYYEVSEDGRQFSRAGSPYIIKNQKVINKMVVRAIDRAGNIRIAEVNISASIEQDVVRFRAWPWFLVAIIMLLILFKIIYNKYKI